MYLSTLDGGEAIADFVREVRTNSLYGDWITEVMDWSDKNGIECQPIENDGWCAKITITENGKRLHEYVEPMRRPTKKAMDAGLTYTDIVTLQLSKAVSDIRKASLTGRIKRDYASGTGRTPHRATQAA